MSKRIMLHQWVYSMVVLLGILFIAAAAGFALWLGG